MFKENKRIISILMGITFLFTILITGYAVRLNRSQNKIKVEHQNIKNNLETETKADDLQISVVDKNIVGIATKITYKIKYNKCNHETIENKKPTQDMMGLDRKSFEDYVDKNLHDWKMSMFSKDEVHLLIEKDTFCTNHFIVGEKNGNITIFTIDENGEKKVHRIFKDATISTIREENQKRLRQGIVVDSEEEAIQVLEDFIS